MNRRAFVRGGLAVVPALSAGCLSWFSRGTVELYVSNWTAEDQTFDIRVERGGEVEYEDTTTLPGGESVRETDILDGGRYRVVVSVDGGPTEDFEFRMGECEAQEITVLYQGRTELEIHRKQC